MHYDQGMVGRNQFSLNAILIGTTFVAVLCGILFALPNSIRGTFFIVGVLLALPIELSAIVYGKGSSRAFAIGAVAPTAFLNFWLIEGLLSRPPGHYLFELFEAQTAILLCTSVIFVSGVAGLAVRWWYKRSPDNEPAETKAKEYR